MYLSRIKPLLSALMLLALGMTSVWALPESATIKTFALPPNITYPTSVAASATGEVYVSVDKNSSLDQQSQMGKIVRCEDTDGDGTADKFTDYVPNIDSPRGSCFVHGTLYVVNPPFLTAFRDTDNDGVADETKVLVKGLGFDLSFRGADHTSNGVRMGIDGWLYMAIGDYGFVKAEGTDGSSAHLHGGGVVRVRPDGSHLEHFAKYTRNIYDVAISPTLDLFSRDNTNDGKGWNTRLHQFTALGNHGYPRLYKNFPDEIIQPLDDYGGGSGTGGLFLDEPGIPAEYNNTLYTCDYTTQGVYQHELKRVGDTFIAGQEKFHGIRAIDIDVDGQSNLYVCDWAGGGYRFDKEDVGAVYQISFGSKQPAFPDLASASTGKLIKYLASKSAVLRINAQRELLTRPSSGSTNPLVKLIRDTNASIEARVAAIFTLKQWIGERANPVLAGSIQDNTIAEYLLRAMADIPGQTANADVSLYRDGLVSEDPRIVLQSVIGLVRLGKKEYAPEILSLGARKSDFLEEAPAQRLPHTIVKALVALNASEACLSALNNPAQNSTALAALQEMHSDATVNGLISKLDQSNDPFLTRGILRTLFRLYHKDEVWDGTKWWTTRPDDRGPYFTPQTWAMTPAIQKTIEEGFNKVRPEQHSDLLVQLRRNRIDPTELALNVQVDEVIALIESSTPGSFAIAPLTEAALDTARDPETRLQAFRTIGRIVGREAFLAQLDILSGWEESEKENTLFQNEKQSFIFSSEHQQKPKIVRDVLRKPKGYQGRIGMMIALNIRQSPLSNDYMKKLVSGSLAKHKNNSEYIFAIGEMGLTAFKADVEAAAQSKKANLAKAGIEVLKQLAATKDTSGALVADLSIEEATKRTLNTQGDATLGKQLFARQGCVACHTVNPDDAPKGPYLGDAGKKWKRFDLIQSVMEPNAIVAQGFQTQWFETSDDFSYEGFVTSIQDGEIEVRNVAGIVTRFKQAEVVNQGTRTTSMMPSGLAANLTIHEFASLIDYLQSLH